MIIELSSALDRDDLGAPWPLPRKADCSDVTPAPGVKVKILVRKKCADGCGLYVFGFHKNLGFGCIERAVPMLSQDGEVWWRQVAFSPNESITYQFVVKRMKQEIDTQRRVVESTPCTFETIWS